MSDHRPTDPTAPTPLPPPSSAPDEHAMEVRLSKLLTLGTSISAAVVLLGIAMYLWRHSGDRLDFTQFRQHTVELNAPTTILSKAFGLDVPAIMQLGVLLLVLTPVARVAFTLLAFLVRRDWMYVAIATIVLAVLSLGLMGIRVH
jgi:uncharacterized membrane protein